MSNELEGRVDRLERALAHGLGINIAEHDDADQAETRAKAADADVAATDAAKALADEHGVDLSSIEGSGAEGQIIKPDVAAAVEGA